MKKPTVARRSAFFVGAIAAMGRSYKSINPL